MRKKIVNIFVIILLLFTVLSVSGKNSIIKEKNNVNLKNEYSFFRNNWVEWDTEKDYITPVFNFKNLNESNTKWTLMFYLAGDNNLEYSMIDILNELEVSGSTDNVKMVAQLDRIPSFDNSNYDWTEMLRFFVTKDPEGYNHQINSEVVEFLGEQNLGDPEVLFDFVNWSVSEYPADNYCLFLADHGHAWDGCCYDWTSDGDYLTTIELKSVLSDLYNIIGKKLDILCFNACAMGSTEVNYQLKDYVKISIGSEDFQYGPLSYMYFIADLINNTKCSIEQFAEKIVNHTAYSGKCFVKDLFAIKLDEVDEIVNKISTLSDHLEEIAAEDANNISDIIYQSILIEHRYRTELADIWDFANSTQEVVDNQNVYDIAQEIKDLIDNSVIESYSTNLDQNRPGYGMNIHLFDESSILEDNFYDIYLNLDISQNTFWDEFLLTYYNAEKINSPPSIPIVNGEINGKILDEYEYCAQSTDPERQYVHLKFSFEDGTETEWLNREVFCNKHTWKKPGTYIVKVKAIDEPFFDQDISKGNESDWGTLNVNMPREKTFVNNQLVNSFTYHFIIKFLSNIL